MEVDEKGDQIVDDLSHVTRPRASAKGPRCINEHYSHQHHVRDWLTDVKRAYISVYVGGHPQPTWHRHDEPAQSATAINQ
jgi:hypothetical protein